MRLMLPSPLAGSLMLSVRKISFSTCPRPTPNIYTRKCKHIHRTHTPGSFLHTLCGHACINDSTRAGQKTKFQPAITASITPGHVESVLCWCASLSVFINQNSSVRDVLRHDRRSVHVYCIYQMYVFACYMIIEQDKHRQRRISDVKANPDATTRPDSVSSCLPAWFPMMVRSATPTIHTGVD